jgi:hypothetical protein
MGKIPPKFSFTIQTPLPCFGSDFGSIPSPPVTHNPSRKQFVAKLLGASAALSVAPGLFAKTDSSSSTAPATAGKTSSVRKFEVRHDARAVARRDTV